MYLLKNLKKAGFLLALCLVFSINSNANSIESIETTEIMNFHSSYEIDNNYLNINDCFFKDGKGKEKWKAFWKGFSDGIYEGVGGKKGAANNGGVSAEDLAYLEKFAEKTVKNQENYTELMYNINALILDPDSKAISKRELLNILSNDARLLDIIANGDKDFFPLDTTDETQTKANGKGWNRFGYILGRILTIWVINQL